MSAASRVEALERATGGGHGPREFDVYWSDEAPPFAYCGATETCPHRQVITLSWFPPEGGTT